jgi:hypothetical protein
VEEHCPIVPLSVVARSGGSVDGSVFVTMDAAGQIQLPPMNTSIEARRMFGRLDRDGCVVDAQGTVVLDSSTPTQIWTPYHVSVHEPGSDLGAGAGAMRIEDDGKVRTVDRSRDNGEGFTVQGYRKEGTCAARVLLVVIESVMSFGRSDPERPRLPPPSGTRCAHRPSE